MIAKKIHVFINIDKTTPESTDISIQEMGRIFHTEDVPNDIELSIEFVDNSKFNDSNLDTDYSFVKYSIDNSQEDEYIICSKDNVVSTLSPQELYQNISNIINLSPDFDIYYMANYMDTCSNHTNYTGTTLVTSVGASPGPILTIMLSPKGKEKFTTYFNSNPVEKQSAINTKSLGNHLNVLISNKFNAVVTVPSLLSFNILTRKNDSEFKFGVQCRMPQAVRERQMASAKAIEQEIQNRENTGWEWWQILIFILVIIMVIVGIFYLFKYTGYHKSSSNSVK